MVGTSQLFSNRMGLQSVFEQSNGSCFNTGFLIAEQAVKPGSETAEAVSFLCNNCRFNPGRHGGKTPPLKKLAASKF
jgi:hypothetical protein